MFGRSKRALLLVLLSACAPARESELLEVHEVSPERIEPGHDLHVRGDGFPPGRDATLRIEGRLHAPGEAPREVSIELDARATDDEHVEAPFTDTALAALGGRGTLHGHATVLFEAGPGFVVGRSPQLVLDVTPPSTEHLGDELARRRRAQALADRLGLALARESPDAGGLRVERVAPGSIADEAGLIAGDRIVSLARVRLHAMSDFVPPPGSTRARASIAREGLPAPFVVSLPVEQHSDRLSPEELRAAQAALGWVLLVLLLLAPSAWITEALARRPRALDAPVGSRAALLRRHGAVLLRVSSGAAFLASVVVLDRAGLLRVPLEALVLAVLALRTTDGYLSARAGGMSGPKALWAGAAALGPAALIAVALFGAAAMFGTSDLSALQRAQGPAPWAWSALRTPAGPLLAGLLVVAGAWGRRARDVRGANTMRGARQGPLDEAPAREADRPLHRAHLGRFSAALDDALALALAAALVGVLLGGWSAGETPGARALGAAAFVLKGLVCWTAMRRAGAIRWRARGKIVIACLALASVALTAGWIVWTPGAEVERSLAEVLTATLALVLLWLFVRRVTGVAPHHAPAPPHPFL